MSQGYRTRGSTATQVMHTRHFNMGYADAKSGKPFTNDYDDWDINDQQNYERGRQFAIATNGSIAVKEGKRVRSFAAYHLYKLVDEAAIL